MTLFGAVAVTAMLIFYGLESRSANYVLAFAAACLASSCYGFMQGAWPFGVVEAIWSLVALRRWWRRRVADSRGHAAESQSDSDEAALSVPQSRSR